VENPLLRSGLAFSGANKLVSGDDDGLLTALEASGLDLEGTKRLIAENEERGGWLIFYTHDIQDAPSPYGCTAAHFESVVKLAAQSRSRIATVAAALASPQLPTSA